MRYKTRDKALPDADTVIIPDGDILRRGDNFFDGVDPVNQLSRIVAVADDVADNVAVIATVADDVAGIATVGIDVVTNYVDDAHVAALQQGIVFQNIAFPHILDSTNFGAVSSIFKFKHILGFNTCWIALSKLKY